MGDWFKYLKENGVYDNTRIILVSDHGPEFFKITDIGLPFVFNKFNPLLMMKDFGAHGDLEIDNTFMSNADVPSLALKDIIENPVNPFTGNLISMDDKKSPLYIFISGSSRLDSPDALQIKLNPAADYYVHDDIFNPENWEKANFR
jgi:hypothetical protein